MSDEKSVDITVYVDDDTRFGIVISSPILDELEMLKAVQDAAPKLLESLLGSLERHKPQQISEGKDLNK